ncbi:WASH complex subunit 2-like isoform X4 [Zootermopsis nevadensis]|uniref:WASH complex subunit 2-like isoform X4 n=1 Tax=Zootermopsis nevadensis TaxID=136037 RepID=UPI000B8E7960|nr:WASH complex subunit 2-like isoform X4 [Zootermopsis nevadensis]
MGDSKDPVKPWERPWTTDEMRQQSASWNLAGDSGLLRHLQQFSQNLLAQTHATEVTLDSLMEQLRATSTDVSNVTNQFLCLSNTQFLENRVYDDDEDDEKGVPPEEKKEEAKQIKSKEEQEAEVVARVREALTLGISILDNMFDTVEVPASDSEDEESGGRLVLEPHNPYLSQALPYLIGSQPFMEDDHVGLGSPSDSEEEDADKHFIHSSESESESEMDIEQQKGNKKRTRFSVSGSENSEFDGSDGSGGEGPAPGKQKKMEASGLFDSTPAAHTGDMFGGDSPIEDVAVVEDDDVTRDSFAAELTDKLGVAAASITSDQQAPKSRTAGKPTLEWYEDDDNSLFGEQVGKFSGGQGLFDGVEDTSGSLWNTKDKLNADKGVKKRSGEASLFGSDTGFEDGIFDSAADTEKTKRLLRVATTGVLTSTPETWVDVLGLSNDCEISNIKTSPVLDGDLFAAPVPTSRDSVQVIVDQQHSIKKKNRAGAESSVFGGVNVFKAGVRRPPSSSSCSSDGTVPTFEYTDSISSGIGQTRSEQQDSTKSLGISAANNVSLFGGSDYLFDPVPTSRNDHSAVVIKNEKIPPEAVTASDLFHDESTGDSVLSKPQKGLAPCSAKLTTEGDSVRRVGTASRKPFSLFNDSDSGDDELLFSSTSSTSSRSRRSQGSGDLLTEPGDKGRPTTVPRKGLFDNEDLFGGAKDEPYFDIFSTGANTAIVKPNSLPEQNKNGNEDLFSEQLNDPEFNLFKPFNTTPEKLKSDDKDALFGDDGSRINAKPGKSIAQVSDSHSSFKDSGSVKPSWGLFSDSGSDDTHDIFAVPVNKAHRELSPSKATLVNSLFSGGSVLEDSKDDLFAGPVKAKNESKDISETDGFLDKIDDIFSVSRTASSSKVEREKKVINGHYAASDSEFVTESESARKDELAEVSGEVSDVISSGIFSEVRDENGSDLFNRSTANPSVNTKPVIANKPVISPKPKLSPVSKPPLLQDTAKGSGDLSSKMNTDENILQLSNPTNTKERSDNLSAKSGQKIEVHDSFAERTERLISPGSSVPPSKLRPPKTLNIRKSTGLLFSSSSNEDEDLFGMSVPEKVLMDSNSAKAVDQKPISNLVIVQPQCSSVDVARPVSFSAEKCANSGKEISSKVGCSQDSNDNSTAKARSVGASPRHLNIDPVALLIGVRPSRNVEAAVSFDEPAQFSATLHNAGKDRARIQAKRRPPSRRARKEAVRLSGIDHDGFETASVMAAEKVPNPAPDKSDDIQEPVARTAEAPGLSSTESQPPASHTVGSLSKPRSSSFLDGSSNLLSPSTDEEDLFGVPQDLPSEYGSNKDDGQNLFSYAPVLSPLDSLLKFPAESDPSKCVAIDTGGKFSTSDVLHTSKLLEDSSDKMPAVRTSPTSSNGSNMAVPNMSSGSHDIRVTGPPLHTLHGSLHNCDENDDSNDLFSETKKTVPSSRKDKQDLFDTTRNSESLFASEKSIPELDVSNYLPEGTGILSDCPENARPLSKDYLSSKYPLPVDDEKPPVPENIMQSNAQEELFGSGYLKHNLFTPRKGSSEKVDDDMFLTSNMDNSICSDSGDELFSVGTNSSLNKDNKNKSDITKPKEICDIDENILFSSGDKQKQPLPTQKNLFSNNAKDINTPKLAVSETGSNSGLFGGDSPESDDIFFDISSKKKAANAIMKGKLSGVVTSSAKGSLFGGDDDDDDIFGSDKSASKSAVFPKPAIATLDNADALFVSGLTKKKPQTKLNRPTGSSSSRQTVTAEGDLFEDPLMVVTKK